MVFARFAEESILEATVASRIFRRLFSLFRFRIWKDKKFFFFLSLKLDFHPRRPSTPVHGAPDYILVQENKMSKIHFLILQHQCIVPLNTPLVQQLNYIFKLFKDAFFFAKKVRFWHIYFLYRILLPRNCVQKQKLSKMVFLYRPEFFESGLSARNLAKIGKKCCFGKENTSK